MTWFFMFFEFHFFSFVNTAAMKVPTKSLSTKKLNVATFFIIDQYLFLGKI